MTQRATARTVTRSATTATRGATTATRGATTASGGASAGAARPAATNARNTPRPAARPPVARPPVARPPAARPPAARPVAARPELRLVPAAPPARPRRQIAPGLASRRAPFVLLVVALLVVTTVGLLILNTAIAVDSLKATELRAANAERAQEVQRLERQVVAAGTPAEVAGAAVAAGLVPAGSAAFLVIAADGSSTLRGIPEPAEAPPAPVAPATRSPAAQSPAGATAGTAGGG
jgi:hypothetical protein